MTDPAPAGQAPALRHARAPAAHLHHRVGYAELFFDLVFVLAVTQLSHALIAHPTPAGLYQTALLTMAVWRVWIFTAWATNWADPDKASVRLMLFGLMAAGLVMSISIPTAVGDEFALAHAAGHGDLATVAAIVGGPFLYLLGCAFFKRATGGWFPLSHLAALALLLPVGLLGGRVAPWLTTVLTSLVLVVTAAWEQWSLGSAGVNAIGHPWRRNRPPLP